MGMTTEAENARAIAERIAKRVSTGATPLSSSQASSVAAELSAVRAGLNELHKKVAQLESRVAGSPVTAVPATHSPWLAGVNASFGHPSEEKFGVEEATVSELVDFFEKEKMCSLEPGGKPCDHCAMCSSRGF
jgi:hypothetical protein